MDCNYLPLFVQETRENLQALSQCLLRLEQNPTDSEAVNEIFRAFHTVKGMAATMGFADISGLAHEAENYLDKLRHNAVAVTPEVINAFFAVADIIDGQLEKMEQNGQPDSLDPTQLASIRQALVGARERFAVQIELSEDCIHRVARALVIINALAALGEVESTKPQRNQLSEDLKHLECVVCCPSLQALESTLASMVEIAQYKISPVDGKAGPKDHQVHRVPRPQSTIRVDVDKLDHLLNLVSELVINKTAIQQGASQVTGLADSVEHLHRLTGDLQDIVMKMRMVPLETVFNRFPRMVRDTARALNKSVQLVVEGADTELDRTIIEDIADPLVHLLRNSIDHGIEPIEQRERLGKPATGIITLRAYQTGNQVIIAVSDDGAGLDMGKIRKKALEMGLFQDNREPSAKDLQQAIFVTGFSTATNVTDLSGRGVGLDAVKKSIEALGGEIDVSSTPGRGTTFRIALPLTLAIIQGMLVRCGEEIYAIPLSFIRETEVIYPEDIKTVGGQTVVLLRGQVLPIVFLSRLVGVPHSQGAEMNLVVVRHGERNLGLVIDDLLSQQEIVIKNISWGHKFFKNFLGTTILGDGSVVLILDINNLLATVKVSEGEENGQAISSVPIRR